MKDIKNSFCETEFNLSDTGTEDLVNGKVMLVFTETRVKEFIKRLKEQKFWIVDTKLNCDICNEHSHLFTEYLNKHICRGCFIDKIAGEKLI